MTNVSACKEPEAEPPEAAFLLPGAVADPGCRSQSRLRDLGLPEPELNFGSTTLIKAHFLGYLHKTD